MAKGIMVTMADSATDQDVQNIVIAAKTIPIVADAEPVDDAGMEQWKALRQAVVKGILQKIFGGRL